MTTEALTGDEKRLAELGYKQELKRGWSSFSNFAISFSIISVLAGCFTSYGQAFNNGGPVAISIGWPVISLLILCVAFSMSELASAFPTAGGIYFWASRLGGAGWGWFTGWFNLIGLVAVVASVDYAAASFLQFLLGLYNVDFVFNFASTNVHYDAHVVFALFALILLIHGLINVFSGHLVSLFNGVSVWWHVVGVAVIVILLIAVPSHHASFSYVFGHRSYGIGGFSHGMYWFYILPLGFLLTMYTITGYDASAHVSEETHGADESAPKGVWRSVFYSAVIGWILLLALTFAVQQKDIKTISAAGFPVLSIITTALSSAAAKAVILISTIGRLFCGMACVTSASRMTFAFSRDGAIPGHRMWRRLGANGTPSFAVLFVCLFALVITIPAFFPNSVGYPVAFFAVTSIAVIGLYIAYTIPVFLRWRKGADFGPGPWTLGAKYKWVNPIAFIWVALCVVIFCLPTSQAGVFFKSGFSWGSVNYAPIVTIVVMLSVTLWYLISARHSFKGPVNTLEFADDGITVAEPSARSQELPEQTLAVLEPATEAVLEEVPRADAETVDRAVARAKAAYPAWRAVSPADRSALLRRVADAVADRREELALLEARNAGKPIGDARGEMDMVAETLHYYAAAPERVLGDSIPVAGGQAFTVREPLGVVGLIVPWNFPLVIAGWKLGPALAAGNTVVLKPAELTPLSALRFEQIAVEAGLPEGVVNVVVGPGSTCGQRLVEHPDVAKIAFTGSTEVGRSIAAGAANTIKRVTLELGGKSPNLVFADADLEAAAAAAPAAVFGNAGQDCCARSRILVERSVLDEFMSHLSDAVASIRVGDPLDEATQMGPLISAAQRESVASFVNGEAPVAVQGTAPDGPGFWFPPTVLCPVSPQARAAREEIFGPVAAVIPFESEAEAIELANDTIYGLSGSVWTRDGGRALRVARAIDAGVLSINSNTSVRVATPFGGFKQSGYGRELGPHALDAYTEVKSIFYATS